MFSSHFKLLVDSGGTFSGGQSTGGSLLESGEGVAGAPRPQAWIFGQPGPSPALADGDRGISQVSGGTPVTVCRAL
jgi:hypothetical protein